MSRFSSYVLGPGRLNARLCFSALLESTAIHQIVIRSKTAPVGARATSNHIQITRLASLTRRIELAPEI
jgi:hypothetical protein